MPRRSSCACSIERGEQRDRARSSCRNTPTRSGTATCPTRGPARLRLPRARPLRARGRPPLQSQQAPARSLRQADRRLASSGTRPCSATGWRSGDDLTFDERDSAPFMHEGARHRPRLHLGRDRRPHVPWEKTVFYETHVRGFTMRHPAVPEDAARHLCGPRLPRRSSTTSAPSASPPSSCCRSTPSSTTAT